jgi:hypothetical protein
VGKHLDEVVVQAIVELALQMPRELGMLKVAGMNWQHVSVDRNGRVLEVDQHFDNAVILPSGKSQQRMLVEPQVIDDFLQGVGHGSIVLRREKSVLSSQHLFALLGTENSELRTALQAAIRIGLRSEWKARLIGGMAR